MFTTRRRSSVSVPFLLTLLLHPYWQNWTETFIPTARAGIKVLIINSNLIRIPGEKHWEVLTCWRWEAATISLVETGVSFQIWTHNVEYTEKGAQTGRGSRRLKPRLFGVPMKRLFCSCSRIWRYKLLSWASEKLLKLLALYQNINHSSPWDSFAKAGLASTVASIDTTHHGSSKSCQVLTVERKAVIILLYWGKCIPLK